MVKSSDKPEIILRKSCLLKCINGMWIPVNGSAGLDRFMHGNVRWRGKVAYQLPSLLKAVSYDKKPLVAVDVGAHIGLWARILSQLYAGVIAIEPLEEHVRCLELNAPGDNVEIHRCALTAPPAPVMVEMELDTAKGLMNRLATENTLKPKTAVPAFTLDDVVGLRDVSFVKIDVEGAELEVLKGATETIDRCHPVFCLEQKDLGKDYRPGEKQYAACQYLKDRFGYRVADHSNDDWVMVPR